MAKKFDHSSKKVYYTRYDNPNDKTDNSKLDTKY